MDREKFKEVYKKFSEADKNYQDYVNQFFTTTWNGEVTKEATKVLNSEALKEIQRLREIKESLKRELDFSMDKLAN